MYILIKGADILVVCSFGELLSPSYLDNFQCALNVHPSLLPQWRGANPLQQAILSSEKCTGVTVQTIAPKFDRGEIVAQSSPITIGQKELIHMDE